MIQTSFLGGGGGGGGGTEQEEQGVCKYVHGTGSAGDMSE